MKYKYYYFRISKDLMKQLYRVNIISERASHNPYWVLSSLGSILFSQGPLRLNRISYKQARKLRPELFR
jgi:hypothetical protein